MYTSIVVRTCIKSDIPQLSYLERVTFEDEDQFTIEELEQIYDLQVARQKSLSNGSIIRVAELSIDGGKPIIAGYVYFHKETTTKRGIRNLNIEIQSIAVDPIYRRNSVGRRLIESIFSLGDFFKSKTSDYNVTAAVPEQALGAQLFFKAMGFTCTQIIDPTDSEDIALYQFELKPSPQPVKAGRSNARKDR